MTTTVAELKVENNNDNFLAVETKCFPGMITMGDALFPEALMVIQVRGVTAGQVMADDEMQLTTQTILMQKEHIGLLIAQLLRAVGEFAGLEQQVEEKATTCTQCGGMHLKNTDLPLGDPHTGVLEERPVPTVDGAAEPPAPVQEAEAEA